MAKAPPKFTIPAPPAKKTSAPKSENSTYVAFINAHKGLKPYASAIRQWADTYGGLTPTQLAAVIWTQSKGNPQALLSQKVSVPAGATNAAGVGFETPGSAPGSRAQEIQVIAWRMSGEMVRSQGNVDQAYQSYTGTAGTVSQSLPKGYVALPSATTTATVTKSLNTSTLKSATTDPWVVETNGKLTLNYSATAPKGTVKYGGTPLTQSEFNQVWKQTYSDTFQAYTGHTATAKQIVQILSNAPSVYALSNTLASEAGFNKSPVYKQHAPGLQGIADQILGTGAKLPPGLLATAISQNWDQATFEQHLRSLPEYRQGPEFQTNLAQNTAAFQQIYGTPDAAVTADLANKTAAGWTPDELQTWLRQQDSYKYTPEYQSKMLSLMGPSGLGLITGQQATLSTDQVTQMLNSQAQLAAGTKPGTTASVQQPDQSTGALARAGVGVDGALGA